MTVLAMVPALASEPPPSADRPSSFTRPDAKDVTALRTSLSRRRRGLSLEDLEPVDAIFVGAFVGSKVNGGASSMSETGTCPTPLPMLALIAPKTEFV